MIKLAVLTLSAICILITLAACTFFDILRNPNSDIPKNPNNDILTFQGLEYAGVGYFQINPAYFLNGLPKDEDFTKIGIIASCNIYAINGLDSNDWIYYPFGDCDQGFYLSKNTSTQLSSEYFDFADTLEVLVQYYTVKDGLQTRLDKKVTDKTLVDYISRMLESKDTVTDIGEIADIYKSYTYTIFLTPKLYQALQFRINYCESNNGYFINSNIPSDSGVFPEYIEVDDTIHSIIN